MKQIELKGNLSSILEVNCLEQIVVCLQGGNKIPLEIYDTLSAKFFSQTCAGKFEYCRSE
jgi:hypothetical protein